MNGYLEDLLDTVETFFRQHSHHPLMDWERQQIYDACVSNTDLEEPKPNWEFPWIVCDMVFLLRNWEDLSTYDPWGGYPDE